MGGPFWGYRSQVQGGEGEAKVLLWRSFRPEREVRSPGTQALAVRDPRRENQGSPQAQTSGTGLLHPTSGPDIRNMPTSPQPSLTLWWGFPAGDGSGHGDESSAYPCPSSPRLSTENAFFSILLLLFEIL